MKNQETPQRELPVRLRELSKREKEVVQFVAKGYKSKEVAEALGIKVKTVETHRANIMNKLALRNVAQLVIYAIQKGLLSVEERKADRRPSTDPV